MEIDEINMMACRSVENFISESYRSGWNACVQECARIALNKTHGAEMTASQIAAAIMERVKS